jgi:hypothetical protein
VFALAEDMGFHPVDVGPLMVRRLTGPRHLDATTVAEMPQLPKRLTCFLHGPAPELVHTAASTAPLLLPLSALP